MPIQEFAIYGAGIVATSIYQAIKIIYGKQPIFFLVTDSATDKQGENPEEIDSIPVVRLSDWQTRLQETGVKKDDLQYIIAVPEVHHAAIEETLHNCGVEKNFMRFLTSDIENQIMEQYYKMVQPETNLNKVLFENDVRNKRGYQKNEIQVFQAKCHADKTLANQIRMPDYIVPIQVGTCFTDQKIAMVQDNQADNISAKNKNYCELTASYYAWRNSEADYKGLCHYRRIFDISDKQMAGLLAQKDRWDVILPYPSIHYPDISTQHIRYINDDDWQVLMQVLKENEPEYFEAYQEAVMKKEQHFLNYNMLIAKKSVFDDYCDFMFRILTKVEELTMPKGENRADRFAGYMGENLTTIYFLKNKERLKIMYAGKKWLV